MNSEHKETDPTMTSTPAEAMTLFFNEIREVRRHLEDAFGKLDSALRHFVRKDLAAAEPFPLAVVVLSAGLPSQDSDSVRRKRIHLAAALEMLRIALSIHEELVASTAAGKTEKSFIGATILVGDYCFSHSAALAAQTDSPFVVEVFSEALKSVSEGRLRTLFSVSEGQTETPGQQVVAYREKEELCVAGAKAACRLADLSPSVQKDLADVAAMIGQTLDQQGPLGDLFDRIVPGQLPDHQSERWQHALTYLSSDTYPLLEESSASAFRNGKLHS